MLQFQKNFHEAKESLYEIVDCILAELEVTHHVSVERRSITLQHY